MQLLRNENLLVNNDEIDINVANQIFNELISKGGDDETSLFT